MISVITPSVRPDFLEIVRKCLNRQTHVDYEWIVCAPFGYQYATRSIIDRPRASDELYSLNKSFNDLFSTSKGELIVSIVDGLWFPPDTLERLWGHYKNNPKILVTAIGNQYDQIVDGKPEHQVWQDPRKRNDFGTFYEVAPTEMELCVASIPKQAVLDCGGMDEIYDKGAAVGEKEMCWRLDRLGYRFFIDQSLEYRAIHHERLTDDWDKWYKVSSELYARHTKELALGTRKLNMGFVV